MHVLFKKAVDNFMESQDFDKFGGFHFSSIEDFYPIYKIIT